MAEAAALANLERKDGNKTMKTYPFYAISAEAELWNKKWTTTGNNTESCRK